ncbi:MAG TPA: hypothetical protein VKU02_15190 [Gemmataceae bacterium]|nr:hypothetical protein [Gemmataceae bacterium]
MNRKVFGLRKPGKSVPCVWPQFQRWEPVRTDNPVERGNRGLRDFEKVRYQWRRPTIVPFIVLAIDR